MTKMTNSWHQSQTRTKKSTFKPKWTKDTILWIISRLQVMEPFSETQFILVRDYDITSETAGYWIEIARRIMEDMSNGLSYEEAEKRDRDRRNMKRRHREKKNRIEPERIEVTGEANSRETDS